MITIGQSKVANRFRHVRRTIDGAHFDVARSGPTRLWRSKPYCFSVPWEGHGETGSITHINHRQWSVLEIIDEGA